MESRKETWFVIFLFCLLVVAGFAIFYLFGPPLTQETMYRTGIALLAPVLVALGFATFDFSKIGALISVLLAAVLYIMYMFGVGWDLWIQCGLFILAATYAFVFVYYRMKVDERELERRADTPTVEINEIRL